MFTRHICRNCRWWQEHSNGGEGFCRMDENMTHMSTIPVRPWAPIRVWAKHDEVRTSPEFGCNQWERKAKGASA